MISICTEFEQHATNNGPQELYVKIKYSPREFRLETKIIKNRNGEIVTDDPGILQV